MKLVIIFAVLIAVASARLVFPFKVSLRTDYRDVPNSFVENYSQRSDEDSNLTDVQFNVCDICMKIAEIVKEIQEFDPSKVKGVIDNFCNMINSEKCREIVDKSIDTIIALLGEGKGVAEICETLNHCHSFKFYY